MDTETNETILLWHHLFQSRLFFSTLQKWWHVQVFSRLKRVGREDGDKEEKRGAILAILVTSFIGEYHQNIEHRMIEKRRTDWKVGVLTPENGNSLTKEARAPRTFITDRYWGECGLYGGG